MSTMNNVPHTDTGHAFPDNDTGIVLTFDTTFALSSAIIDTIRDLCPDEQAETIADMKFFAAFNRAAPEEAEALLQFWRALADLFELEAEHPHAERGDQVWHTARHLERIAAAHLDSAAIRDIHLPGFATLMVN